MTTFDFSDKQISIVNAHSSRVDLSPQEAMELLQWLSDKRTMLLHLVTAQGASQEGSAGQQTGLRTQQEQQDYLDTLDAAIMQMQAAISATGIYVAPDDSAIKRALQLLKAYQIEYHIHPLLEDDSSFAQG